MKTIILTVILFTVVVSPSFAKDISKGYSKPALSQLVDEVLTQIVSGGVPIDKRNYTKLLLETAAVESDFGRLNRDRKSVDKGLYQINIHTYRDIMKNYLTPTTKLKHRLLLMAMLESNRDFTKSDEWNLRHNDYFGVVLAFTVYFRAVQSRRIKQFDKVWTRAWLWKTYYNTHLGLGTTKHYMAKRKIHLGGKG